MMNKKLVFPMLLFVSIVLFSTPLYAAVKVFAKVGEIPITEAEVQRQIDKMMPFRVNFHSKMSKEKITAIKAEAVEVLIERAYKVAYANAEKITVPDSFVTDALAKVKARYKTSAAFEAAVAVETVAGLRASIYRDLVAQKAELIAVEEKIKLTDAAIKNYYNEKKQTFFMPAQFRASHIMIKVDPSSNQEERAALQSRAEELLLKAKSGEDFYNLAYYNSDDRSKFVGGDLGLFHEGRAAKPFEDALKQMQVGEISDLVKTRWGYHIIKLTQKNEPRQFTFLEVQDKIRTLLEKGQREKYYQQWLKELKSKYQVERVGE